VQLLMAMKQRELQIVGQEIDFDRFAARHDDNIFEDPSRGGTCKPRQLKGVAMQMHGVIVIALIVKREGGTWYSLTQAINSGWATRDG
jgi:hypothetical protein